MHYGSFFASAAAGSRAYWRAGGRIEATQPALRDGAAGPLRLPVDLASSGLSMISIVESGQILRRVTQCGPSRWCSALAGRWRMCALGHADDVDGGCRALKSGAILRRDDAIEDRA